MSERRGRPSANGGVGEHYADDLSTLAELKNYLCSMAASFDNSGVKATEVRWRTCEQCESPCAYGRKYVRLMHENRYVKATETRKTLWLRTALEPLNAKKACSDAQALRTD